MSNTYPVDKLGRSEIKRIIVRIYKVGDYEALNSWLITKFDLISKS